MCSYKTSQRKEDVEEIEGEGSPRISKRSKRFVEFATEPGAGTRSGVSWKNLAIRLLVPTLKVFDEYNAPLTRFLSNLPDNEKVILVGHGARGLSLTDALHRFAKKNPSMLLRPGPVRALKGARFEGGKDADSVPRIYIKTLHDQMLEPMKQEQMIKRWQPCQVLVLDSDHSPFFSTPSLLLDLKEQQLPSNIKLFLDPSRHQEMENYRVRFLWFCLGILLLLLNCVQANNWPQPLKNVNLSPLWQWRSAYECMSNESARCSANSKIKQSGAVVVSQSEVVEYCKPGLNTTIFTSSGMKTLQKVYMSSLSSLLALAFITIFNM
ncbi:hypothetical protein NC651_030959 [Populus alba x Populus x berolinensis]|nr:hypothetical protein NC651_030959 [Populus alba x Populus x berolinensis]